MPSPPTIGPPTNGPPRWKAGLSRQKAVRNSGYSHGATNEGVFRELGSEEAEATVISNIEERGNKTVPAVDGFRPAIDGERAPLGIESLGRAFGDDDDDPEIGRQKKRPSFSDMARRVQKVQRAAHSRRLTSENPLMGSEIGGHRRAHTLLARIDEPADETEGTSNVLDFNSDTFGLEPTLLHGLDRLFEDNLVDDQEENSNVFSQASENADSTAESLPLLNDAKTGYSSVAERRQLARKIKVKRRWKQLRNWLNPKNIVKRLLDLLSRSFLLLAIPLFVVAWILFYSFGNPELDFLPGDATLSWWFNFVGRQLLLLELSRVSQFILIDCLTLSFRFVVKTLGAWVTIFCLQSKGWPFIVGCWGLLDMGLLHGDNKFQQHWLHFTGIRIYAAANSGSYILASDVYLRVLLGMVLAGLATTFKRTLVTLYFGKRNFETYKPKLEEILNNIIIISEVAELAAEADNLTDEEESVDTEQMISASLKKRGKLSQARWSSVRFKNDGQKDGRSRLDSEDTTGAHAFSEHSRSLSEQSSEREHSSEQANDGGVAARRALLKSSSLSDSTKQLRIKNLLDRWEDPLNKQDKPTESTVNDILTFRKALTYMDLEYPFSEAFGPASTRDELIASAQHVYHRLLNLAPGSKVLPSVILSAVADNGDGTVDNSKRRSLRNLFRPDADKEVQLLAFIQSCDSVYKKLRFFRASVGNSSVIDKVLESIIDAIYGFTLGLVILSLLNFNPWPLLVSMSTLMVTFAFAVGPSAAKSIEGILLIVGRRPFDIGDRIIISDTPGGSVPGVCDSWFVEDITLFSTTLRFGASNEVSTVSNGSIASARITNCARSKNATVHLFLKLHINLHKDKNLDLFREALENFVLDYPNVWDSIVFLRCEEIDKDNEFVMYRLAIRSRQSWQVCTRVLQERARLHQFCIELATKLEVSFDSAPARRVLYYGGNLVDGHVKEYKKDLTADQNIQSSGDLGPLVRQAEEAIATEEQGMDTPNPSVVEQVSGENVAVAQSGMTETQGNADMLFLSMVQQSHG